MSALETAATRAPAVAARPRPAWRAGRRGRRPLALTGLAALLVVAMLA